jgi:hypothetical protein
MYEEIARYGVFHEIAAEHAAMLVLAAKKSSVRR